MSGVTIGIEADSEGVQAYLKDAPHREAEVQRLWKEQGSEEIANFMRGVVPVKTGCLRQSIVKKATPNGVAVFPSAPYAGFVDQGTKPHAIFPRNARVLRWFDSSGAPVFSKYVSHPGTKGANFIQRTRDAMSEVLRQLYIMIWREKN